MTLDEHCSILKRTYMRKRLRLAYARSPDDGSFWLNAGRRTRMTLGITEPTPEVIFPGTHRSTGSLLRGHTVRRLGTYRGGRI